MEEFISALWDHRLWVGVWTIVVMVCLSFTLTAIDEAREFLRNERKIKQ